VEHQDVCGAADLTRMAVTRAKLLKQRTTIGRIMNNIYKNLIRRSNYFQTAI
jgi:hypothetical protein